METPSTSTTCEDVCKKEESEDDFTFGQSPRKRMKTEVCPQGRPVKFPEGANSIKEEVEMNWDIVQVSVAWRHLCAGGPGLAHRLLTKGSAEFGICFFSLPGISGIKLWPLFLFLPVLFCNLAYQWQLFC